MVAPGGHSPEKSSLLVSTVTLLDSWVKSSIKIWSDPSKMLCEPMCTYLPIEMPPWPADSTQKSSIRTWSSSEMREVL